MDDGLKKNYYKSEEILKESYELIGNVATDKSIRKKIIDISELIIDALQSGKKVLFFGNGGSAADAQHMAGEFVSKFMFDRKSLPGIALTTDSSVITAVANDYGFQYIFSRQIESIGVRGDIAFGFSTSGKSLNILKGLEVAKKNGLFTVGLTGEEGNSMENYCEILIKIPSKTVPRIQEGHLLIGHTISELVESRLFL
jgi:D-sedoheptulose 7-phosphate isomerase